MSRVTHLTRALLLACCPVLCCAQAAGAQAAGESMRAKDIAKIQGWRENALVGYGIVTGLAGTGDAPGNRATRQALSNVLSQFNLSVAPDQVQSRNVAAVLVSAQLPPFARPGDAIDVAITSIGDARSLVGGSLLLAPLKAPNGRVYALAQGALSVGGYRYDANGNVVQKNHPTAGAIPGGATIETTLPQGATPLTSVTFVLHEPDYTTAARLAEAVNRQIGSELAEARDASGVEVRLPEAHREHPVAFLALLENVSVTPDRRAKVVINERTGTVVAGGHVRISSIAVSHGELRVSIASETHAVQPLVLGGSNPAVHTALVRNHRVDVSEGETAAFLRGGNTVADLVQALTRMRIGTRDIISVLRAVKAAGALHAELIVQ